MGMDDGWGSSGGTQTNGFGGQQIPQQQPPPMMPNSSSMDMLGGLSGLDLNSQQPPPAGQQLKQQEQGQPAGKKTNDDLLGLF